MVERPSNMADTNVLDIVIIGAGGFAREVHGMLWECFSRDHYRLKGFRGLDDKDLRRTSVQEPLLGDPDQYQPAANDRLHTGDWLYGRATQNN